MHEYNDFLSPQWNYYLQKSQEAHEAPYDDLGHGREEQLNEVLDVIQQGDSFGESTRKRLDRLPWNRAKKYRRLRFMLSRIQALSYSFAYHFIEANDEMAVVRQHLSLDNWDIELKLARGNTYLELAPTLGITSEALKVRVNRWRKQFRCIMAAQ